MSAPPFTRRIVEDDCKALRPSPLARRPGDSPLPEASLKGRAPRSWRWPEPAELVRLVALGTCGWGLFELLSNRPSSSANVVGLGAVLAFGLVAISMGPVPLRGGTAPSSQPLRYAMATVCLLLALLGGLLARGQFSSLSIMSKLSPDLREKFWMQRAFDSEQRSALEATGYVVPPWKAPLVAGDVAPPNAEAPNTSESRPKALLDHEAPSPEERMALQAKLDELETESIELTAAFRRASTESQRARIAKKRRAVLRERLRLSRTLYRQHSHRSM